MLKRTGNKRVEYGVTFGTITVAALLRWWLDPLLGDEFPIYFFFVIAIITSTWFGGMRQGLLSTLLSILVGELLFKWTLDPSLFSGLEKHADTLRLAISGIIISLFIGQLRSARQQAEEKTLEILAQQGQLQSEIEVRRRAEQDAHLQREKLRITLASIGDGIITTDTDGHVTFLNAMAERLTGWSTDEAMGKPLEEIFHILNEMTRQPVENPAYQALEYGSIVALVNHTVLIGKDGIERPIDDSAAPINDADGKINGSVLIFRDVTERREAERALRRSEQELNDFFENANVALHWVGSDGTVLRVNQAELDLLGYSREEYLGHNIAEFHADQEAINDILLRLSVGEELHEHPARLRCSDGSIKEVLINSTVFRVDGKFVHSRCITLDITDRKRVQEAQGLLAAIVASSEDAIISKTLDGIITSWNTGAENLFGYTASEATGQMMTLILPPDRYEDEERILESIRQGIRVGHSEAVRRSKDGREVFVSFTVSPILDAEGRIIGASQVARDITARNNAAKALRESEERFRTLADNVSQLIWMADPEGSYMWFNQRWYEYTGTTPEEMRDPEVGRRLHHPDHFERVIASLRTSAEAGEAWEEVFPLRGRDGNYRWFLSRALPIRDDEGNIVRWFGTNTDITEQREAEETLKEADRHKDEFMAMLAHELRNPLAPIRNSLEIVKRANGDTSLIDEARETMDRQMLHLERLVDDLLDISRISQDKIELRKERIELAAVVHQAIETCHQLIESSGHELVVTLPDQPIQIDADPVRLAQVFTNLLNNACKYTPAGGRIEIAAGEEGERITISVKDSGLGIPNEMLHRVFDLFTQIQGEFRQSQGGLGIGLTLVRRLVQMHNGTVEVRSEGEGRGSTFVIDLPRAVEEPAVELSLSAGVEPPEQSRRILIVDDNRDAAKSLAILLKIKGHETYLAFSGEEAIKQAAAIQPEVVFMDIGMPVLNGHEVARKIREQPWGKGIVLVALTGWGQEEDRRKSSEAGFDYHLVKPVRSAALLNLLSTVPAIPLDTTDT